jgi:hypothetical protein
MVSFVTEAQLNREDSHDAMKRPAGRPLRPRHRGKPRCLRYKQESLEKCLVLLVVCAVRYEPVSGGNSLLTGNFAILGAARGGSGAGLASDRRILVQG